MDGIILLFSFKSLQLEIVCCSACAIIDCCSKPHPLHELVLFELVRKGCTCPLCPALDPPLIIVINVCIKASLIMQLWHLHRGISAFIGFVVQTHFPQHAVYIVFLHVQLGQTPLWTASVSGHQKCMELLINAGANVDIPNEVSVSSFIYTHLRGHQPQSLPMFC